MKILHLTLHKKWFDEIASGNKVFEYREIKPYWTKRLKSNGQFKKFDEIHFTNGYGKDKPFMCVQCLGLTYGTFEGRTVYAIGLGKILEIRNHNAPPRNNAHSKGEQ